ncbi:division/cell wall cluster transcriptional repressor MraZ [Meridianimarinicoccus aquatilis]|uniref:Transcriptional regulator MraZ n=1 Tax=Meridianimarinicoccus aquatilis TaxID=2552766 RepID=A0A4V3BAU5_9RHOB|nr:hypothetical protein [Fluviibacterium aquatile]QIE41678.1 hypothetical protein G5B39_06740 [Rhodobacteraceae bacterium SC52]TDL84459.1 hypothetical protein E2L05_18140 [Fluviibacterium aquatile]
MSIPAKFCRVLEANDPKYVDGLTAKLVLLFGDTRSAVVTGYSADGIAKMEQVIERMPPGSRQRAAMEYLLYNAAEEVDVDGSGRIVLPRKVREKLGFTADGEAVFDGRGDRFQIRNATEHQDGTPAWVQDALNELEPDQDFTAFLQDAWSEP